MCAPLRRSQLLALGIGSDGANSGTGWKAGTIGNTGKGEKAVNFTDPTGLIQQDQIDAMKNSGVPQYIMDTYGEADDPSLKIEIPDLPEGKPDVNSSIENSGIKYKGHIGKPSVYRNKIDSIVYFSNDNLNMNTIKGAVINLVTTVIILNEKGEVVAFYTKDNSSRTPEVAAMEAYTIVELNSTDRIISAFSDFTITLENGMSTTGILVYDNPPH